eukprot:CAMPEP_0176348330 /NCGR_PEP_ID=MMETSP0126-20121128/7774_1 /TAXON_ID=141414 ORGANISM="Strombidinopsis acuminatum, Strain SPMC142" /NCGR_SAMPLE_ID=MMETSP0126 /ASSEMBLY_ACC=CAM_ASM_000229 /LENGTH=84 /DNA_ID=CAMNT_0017697047 /DNA_START=1264 /DNA_END=1518 /DNA_ORIENTATION=+
MVQYLDYDQTDFEFVFASNDSKVTLGANNKESKKNKHMKKLIANFILIAISLICCAEFANNQATHFHLQYYMGHFCYGSIVMIG